MVEKNNSNNINKQDLDLILEVNKKTVEIQTEVADQNEEILSYLEANKKEQDELLKKIDKIKESCDSSIRELDKKIEKNDFSVKDLDKKIDSVISSIKGIDKVKENTENISKDLFKIQVLFVSGLISLVIQIIQMFKK